MRSGEIRAPGAGGSVAERLGYGIKQRIRSGRPGELAVVEVRQPLDEERRATLHEEELRLARQSAHLVGQEERSPLLRPRAAGDELALSVRPATHATGLVLALDVDRRLAGHS